MADMSRGGWEGLRQVASCQTIRGGGKVCGVDWGDCASKLTIHNLSSSKIVHTSHGLVEGVRFKVML